jgi:Domain of unknown function (DUF4274)
MTDRFKSYDAEQRAMIDWLTGRSPDARHAIALDLNFDFAEDVFEWVLTQPDCDLATAASYFWRAEPLERLEHIASFPEDNLTIMRLVERVNAGFYSRSEIFYRGQEPRNGEEVDSTTLQEAEMLREFARTHKPSDLPWTLPEALVPPFGHRAVRILEEEDFDKSEELRILFAGLGTGSGPTAEEFTWANPSQGKTQQPAQSPGFRKGTARSGRSDFAPLYLYIAFVMVGWGLIYIFEPPRLAYIAMTVCCIQFGIAAVIRLRSRK